MSTIISLTTTLYAFLNLLALILVLLMLAGQVRTILREWRNR